jgi:glutaredoxin-related protein
MNIHYGYKSRAFYLMDNIWDAVKLYANWLAYPQIYCIGSLIGGSDIVVALHENGELSNLF